MTEEQEERFRKIERRHDMFKGELGLMNSLPECLYCNGYLHDEAGNLFSCDKCPTTFHKEGKTDGQ